MVPGSQQLEFPDADRLKAEAAAIEASAVEATHAAHRLDGLGDLPVIVTVALQPDDPLTIALPAKLLANHLATRACLARDAAAHMRAEAQATAKLGAAARLPAFGFAEQAGG